MSLGQSDATAWMAFYALTMATIADRLARQDTAYTTKAVHFLEQFARIAHALDTTGLWDEQDAFYYDRLRLSDGQTFLLKVRSMVGLIPLLASAHIDPDLATKAAAAGSDFAQLGEHALGRRTDTPTGTFVSMVEPAALAPMLADLFDEGSFLGPFGLRSLSARLRDHPYQIPVPDTNPIDYEPAEAATPHMNSNWRGPVWMPLNYLLIDAIARIGDELGDQAPTLNYPTGTGTRHVAY